MTVDEALDFIRQNHAAILATHRSDGGIQQSPVGATVDAEGRVIVSSRETAVKTRNLRRNPRATLLVTTGQHYGPWVQVEGPVEIVSLPEAMEPLVDYYRRISGEHPDWDEYRRAMVDEKRVLLRVSVDRAGPNVSG